MRGPFETIEDFLCIRENCVFCQRKLKCVLSSFDVGPRSLPIFNAYVQNLEKKKIFNWGFLKS